MVKKRGIGNTRHQQTFVLEILRVLAAKDRTKEYTKNDLVYHCQSNYIHMSPIIEDCKHKRLIYIKDGYNDHYRYKVKVYGITQKGVKVLKLMESLNEMLPILYKPNLVYVSRR